MTWRCSRYLSNALLCISLDIVASNFDCALKGVVESEQKSGYSCFSYDIGCWCELVWRWNEVKLKERYGSVFSRPSCSQFANTFEIPLMMLWKRSYKLGNIATSPISSWLTVLIHGYTWAVGVASRQVFRTQIKSTVYIYLSAESKLWSFLMRKAWTICIYIELTSASRSNDGRGGSCRYGKTDAL